jgi:hypothetical protein
MTAFYSMRPKASTTLVAPKISGVIEPVLFIGGAAAAHFKFDADEAAKFAGQRLDGKVIILPTMAQVCEDHGTYPAAVIRARGGKRSSIPPASFWLNLTAAGLEHLGEAERVVLAYRYETDLWRALEHVVDIQRD